MSVTKIEKNKFAPSNKIIDKLNFEIRVDTKKPTIKIRLDSNVIVKEAL